MRNLLIIIILLFWILVHNARGQTYPIVAWDYWFDNEHALMTTTVIPPDTSLDMMMALPVPALSNGIHTFHTRFKNSANQYSLVSSSFFYNVNNTLITGYDYWFNENHGQKTSVQVPGSGFIDLSTSIAPYNTPPGLNTLHFRFYLANGTRSLVSSHLFYYNPGFQVNGYEYWYDNNSGARVWQTVGTTSHVDLSTTISGNALTSGLHTVHFRFRNTSGIWSAVESAMFFKAGGGATSNYITGYEYWFDDDDQARVSITDADTLTELAVPLNSVQLPAGLHRLNFRFFNADNSSSVVTSYFYKNSTAGIAMNNITAYRSWFDNDPATLNEVAVALPSLHVVVIDPIVELPYLPLGKHLLSIDFRDISGVYSSVFSDSITVTNCLPYAAKAISGTGQVCPGRAGVAFFIPPIRNATGYQWNLPAGASIVSGNNTNSILVDFSPEAESGLISVSGTNPCGVGQPSQFNVVVTQTPMVSIAGDSIVCVGTESKVYQADPSFFSYTWTVSAGGSIVEGAGTSAITVNWGMVPGIQAVSLTCTGINGCVGSNSLTVEILEVPPSSQNIAGQIVGTGQVFCADATLTIAVPQQPREFLVEIGGSAFLLASQQLRLLPGTRVDSGGYLNAYITSDCFFCNAIIPPQVPLPAPSSLLSDQTSIPEIEFVEGSGFRIYPNPTDGRFTLEISDLEEVISPGRLRVYSLEGTKVLESEIQGNQVKTEHSLAGFPPGIYLLHLTTSHKTGSARIIKR